MAGALRGGVGGILGLLTLPREKWEAIEADLLRTGYRLCDIPSRVGWRALRSFVTRAMPDTATYLAFDPDKGWSTTTELQALMVDLLHLLVWMKTEDGHKNRRRPEPLPRPNAMPSDRIDGVVDASGEHSANGSRFGDAAMTLEETRRFLGW